MTVNKIIFLTLGIIICSSIYSNAAPTLLTSKAQHKLNDKEIGKNSDNNSNTNPNVDNDVKELEHLKHVDKTKEMILPDLQKQLEEEAESSISSELDEQEFGQLNLKQMNVKADENVKAVPGPPKIAFAQHYAEYHSMTTSTEAPMLEEIEEPVEMTNNGQRRSFNNPLGSNRGEAEILLHHSGGQYSAFDMAQYVFWTGDEAGVARAVEELIQEGLMSRENALKFLRDIRLGIDYLQNTYSSHGFKERPFVSEMSVPASSTSTTTTTTTTAPHHVTPVIVNDIKSDGEGKSTTLSPEILKVIDKLPSLLKLKEFNEKDATVDYDDVVGRLRLADFLYAEYSLEEVIYQLAKVMFSQSLVRGSGQAQHALQKLTGFLEAESENGRISPALQRKVLDVLLLALSDTLAENPELLNAARNALGEHMDRINNHNHNEIFEKH